ncbi:MAG: four helix bundle protein [Gemmatimonadales bacterium]
MAGDFKDLIAWQEAVELVAEVVPLVKRFRGPGASDAADQALRASESIPANIAEGYGRGLGSDFARFLRIASGSATELESHLIVAAAAGRIDRERVEPVVQRARRVRALTVGLARSVARRARS